MKRWIRPDALSISDDIIKQIGGNPLVAETLIRRGIREPSSMLAFINPENYHPSSPYELPGMEQAVRRLFKGINNGERILVWGDFDVDGQTSTTLLVNALNKVHANVEYYIPNRERESHGVNLPKLKKILARQKSPSIILTCDTGIAAVEAVSYAKTKNVDFIVSDHHEIPEVLPDAIALVNPNFLDSNHPMRSLPGVGVAFELAKALFEFSDADESGGDLLDLVALGIIADVAKLNGDTRYLAQKGLEILSDTKRIGLQELYNKAQIETERITEEHIGYVIAPRLNAVGRLGDANPIVELLSTNDQKVAREFVCKLEELNRRRRLLMGQVYRAAITKIEKQQEIKHMPVIILAQNGWPAGIIGIVASRIVERYRKPTILISTQSNGKGRASARSVEGLDITTAIATQKKMLDHFGGHPMAAGFAIDVDDIPRFQVGLSRAIEKMGIPEDPSLVIDQVIDWGKLDMNLIEQVERLAPFGAGNPPLVFVSDGLTLLNKKTMGAEGEHLLLQFTDQDNHEKRVVWWHGADEFKESEIGQGKGSLAFIARRSNYLGREEVGIQFVDFHPEFGSVVLIEKKKNSIDLRGEPDPLDVLSELIEINELTIWAEGSDKERLSKSGYHVNNRIDLEPSKRLIIYTTPPSHDVFNEAMDAVSPEEVVFIGKNPEENDLKTYFNRLSSLAKFSINHREGVIPLNIFAASLASDRKTVIAGIRVMAASGVVKIIEIDQEYFRIEKIRKERSDNYFKLLKQYEVAFKEIDAYRSFFKRAPLEKILSK